MPEILVHTNAGIVTANTDPVRPAKAVNPLAIKRVSLDDLNGTLGEFLAVALPHIAPDAFTASNWKGKLTGFITSKTTSFLVCGRSVGLATLNLNVMQNKHEAIGLFIIAAEGGTEEECVEIARQQKQWARDLNTGYYPPGQDYSSATSAVLARNLRAEKVEVLYVSPLAKKS